MDVLNETCDLDDSLTEMDWLPMLSAGAVTALPPLKTMAQLDTNGQQESRTPLTFTSTDFQDGHGTIVNTNKHQLPLLPKPQIEKHSNHNQSQEAYNKRAMNKLEKPSYSFCNLILLAISSSSNHKMTLTDIYLWISSNFPYYKYPGNGWKNSVRHNLSMNKVFVKTPRTKKDPPGKGAFWSIRQEMQDKELFPQNSDRLAEFQRLSTSTLTPSSTSAFASYQRDISTIPTNTTSAVSPTITTTSSSGRVEMANVAFPAPDSNSSMACVSLDNEREVELSASMQSSLYRNTFENANYVSHLPSATQPSVTECSDSNAPVLYESANTSQLSNNNRGHYQHPHLEMMKSALEERPSTEDDETKHLPHCEENLAPASNFICSQQEDSTVPACSSDDIQQLLNQPQPTSLFRENLRLASSFDWNNFDLSSFSELKESMRAAKDRDWKLEPEEITSIASSLNQLFQQAGITVISSSQQESEDSGHLPQTLETSSHTISGDPQHLPATLFPTYPEQHPAPEPLLLQPFTEPTLFPRNPSSNSLSTYPTRPQPLYTAGTSAWLPSTSTTGNPQLEFPTTSASVSSRLAPLAGQSVPVMMNSVDSTAPRPPPSSGILFMTAGTAPTAQVRSLPEVVGPLMPPVYATYPPPGPHLMTSFPVMAAGELVGGVFYSSAMLTMPTMPPPGHFICPSQSTLFPNTAPYQAILPQVPASSGASFHLLCPTASYRAPGGTTLLMPSPQQLQQLAQPQSVRHDQELDGHEEFNWDSLL